MIKKSFIKKVVAKLDAQKIYEKKETQDLINKGTTLFPEYNLNPKQTKKVINFVFQHLKPEYCTKGLHDKIEAGIT